MHLSSGIEAQDIATLTESTNQPGEDRLPEDLILDGMAKLFLSGPAAAFGDFRSVAEHFRFGDLSADQIVRWWTFGLVISNELLDDHAYYVWTERADSAARESGALQTILMNGLGQTEHDLRAGNLASADVRYVEAREIAEAMGLPPYYADPMQVHVHAWRGDEEQAKSSATAMIEIGLALGSAVVLMMGHLALSILHLGAGRYREAFESAEYVCDRRPVGWTSQTLPLAIEAGVRCGEQRRAEEFLVELATRANASGSAWAQGLLARSKALVSKGADAERLFEESVTLLGQTMVLRDLAHTRLLYGEWLRREDRRVDARLQLRAAHEFFVSMGAMGFARRVDAELLATGERVRRRAPGGDHGLTPQELRIAQLAAE
jgi:hypothetical protein